MKRAFFARHGESEYSVRELLNGDAEVLVGLTDAGVEQARRLGQVLRAEPLDLCITSALHRTKLTADVALEGRDVPRLVVPELNDPRYGPTRGSGSRSTGRGRRRRRRQTLPATGARAATPSSSATCSRSG